MAYVQGQFELVCRFYRGGHVKHAKAEVLFGASEARRHLAAEICPKGIWLGKPGSGVPTFASTHSCAQHCYNYRWTGPWAQAAGHDEGTLSLREARWKR